MLSTILIIILILILVGAFPSWPYSRGWGYGPSGVVGLILVILLILLLRQNLRFIPDRALARSSSQSINGLKANRFKRASGGDPAALPYARRTALDSRWPSPCRVDRAW